MNLTLTLTFISNNSFTHLLTHSFTHLLTHSFIHLLTNSLTQPESPTEPSHVYHHCRRTQDNRSRHQFQSHHRRIAAGMFCILLYSIIVTIF